MHQISLAAGTVLESSPPDTVTAAAAAGFDASGVWVDLTTWTDEVAAEVRRRLADTGLTALDVEVGYFLADTPVDDCKRLIDAGAQVGASFALLVSRDPDLERTAAQYAEVCAHAEGTGVRPVLEFMRFMTVRTLADAVSVVTRSGHPDAAILVDTLHLSRCGEQPSDVGALDPHLFPYVQLCDAPAEVPAADQLVDEALNGRLLLGDGALPVRELVSLLAPDVPFSIELRSKALRDGYPDAAERAGVVARTTRSFLAR